MRTRRGMRTSPGSVRPTETRWWPDVTMKGSAFSADRLLAIAFVLMLAFVLVGVSTGKTQATFTGTSTNPTNQALTMQVAAPASQSNTTSAAAGVVNLSWTATPTAPGTGHTLSYDVLRGPVGGPYSFVGNTTSLVYSDTPSADGTYEWVIQAKVAGGGTFTSGNSAAKSGISDRTAPSKTITCNAVACIAGWYNATVSVTVSGTDAGTGMGSVTRNVDAAGQVSTGGSSATFNVSGDNAGHVVQYFSTDGAGNSSATASQTIKLDGTAPTAVTGLLSATGAGGAPITVDLSWTAGTDALSGVSGHEVR